MSDTFRLTPRVVYSTGRDANVSPEWSSANTNVATVGRRDGVVTAVGEGTTTLTVTAGDTSAQLDVSVIELQGTIAFTRFSRRTDGTPAWDVFSYSQRVESSLRRSSQFQSIIAPSWSPDGTRLAVEAIRNVVEDQNEHTLTYDSDLYVFDAASPADASWRALTSDGKSWSPSWSPDGTQIAFVRGSSEPGVNHVYLIDVDRGGLTRLTSSAASYGTPRWSPDGSRLAFVQWGDGISDIFTIRRDGTGLTNVTRSLEYDDTPAWSPDGTHIAFISYGSAYNRLSVIASDGSGLRRLTDRGYAYAPVWSPEGRYIAFAYMSGIWVMDVQSGLPIRVTRSGDSSPAWKR